MVGSSKSESCDRLGLWVCSMLISVYCGFFSDAVQGAGSKKERGINCHSKAKTREIFSTQFPCAFEKHGGDIKQWNLINHFFNFFFLNLSPPFFKLRIDSLRSEWATVEMSFINIPVLGG